MAMWSAVANITFVEAASAATANFMITRGTDRGAHATIAGTRTAARASAARTINTAGGHRLGRLDRHQRPDRSGRSGRILTAYQGGYPLSTVVHEIGHIIGIGHGGPYNGDRQRGGAAVQRLRHDDVDFDVLHRAGR